MKILLFSLVTIILVLPAYGADKFCFESVESEIRQELGGSAKFDIALFSPADITQKITGPLRRNRLSSREVDEIQRFLPNKQIEFYQLSQWWRNDNSRFDLLIVDKKSCKITKRYPYLLRPDFPD